MHGQRVMVQRCKNEHSLVQVRYAFLQKSYTIPVEQATGVVARQHY
jgi:hypothetical protein